MLNVAFAIVIVLSVLMLGSLVYQWYQSVSAKRAEQRELERFKMRLGHRPRH